MELFLSAFSARVRSLRLERHMTQEELAYRAAIHVTYLSGIEQSKRNPSLRNIKKIALALDVSVKDLFDFE